MLCVIFERCFTEFNTNFDLMRNMMLWTVTWRSHEGICSGFTRIRQIDVRYLLAPKVWDYSVQGCPCSPCCSLVWFLCLSFTPALPGIPSLPPFYLLHIPWFSLLLEPLSPWFLPSHHACCYLSGSAPFITHTHRVTIYGQFRDGGQSKLHACGLRDEPCVLWGVGGECKLHPYRVRAGLRPRTLSHRATAPKIINPRNICAILLGRDFRFTCSHVPHKPLGDRYLEWWTINAFL